MKKNSYKRRKIIESDHFEIAIFTTGLRSLGGRDHRGNGLGSQRCSSGRTQWQNKQTQSRDCDLFNTVQRGWYIYVMEKANFNALTSRLRPLQEWGPLLLYTICCPVCCRSAWKGQLGRDLSQKITWEASNMYRINVVRPCSFWAGQRAWVENSS